MGPIRTLRLVLLASAALGAAAASAAPAAAPWSAPATAAPADGVGSCLRGAGVDRLALLGELTATTAATDLLTVAPGPQPALNVRSTAMLGWLLECADVAVAVGDAAPDAPPLLAAHVHVPGRGSEVRVGVPGGAPVTVRRLPGRRMPAAVRVALAASGAAVVSWVERGSARRPGRADAHLMVAFRPRADAAFGPARALDRRVPYQAISPPVLGIDAAGRATVAWHGHGGADEPSLLVAEADGDGRFGRPQALVRGSDHDGPTAIAVAPDGRALLATATWDGPGLFERGPGRRRFAPTRGVEVDSSNEIAVALGRDGAALIATRQQPDHVVAQHRAAGARRFSAPQRLAGRPAMGVSFMLIDEVFDGSDRPQPADGILSPTLGAALDGDGRALLTWTSTSTRWRAAAAMAAASDAAGEFADAAPQGNRCRAATAVRPVPLGHGGLGVAWTDLGRLREGSAGGMFTSGLLPQAGDGRLNVVVPRQASATASAGPAAPRAGVEVLGRRALGVGEPLRLRVRCPRDGSPCMVRAVVTARLVERRDGRPRPRHERVTEQLSDATPLAPGAAAVLRFDPSPGMRIAPLGRGRAEVAVTSCAPSGSAAVRSSLRPWVRGLPRTPSPQLLDVRARRDGGAVRVTGRLSRPARGARLVLLGRPGGAQETISLDRRTRFDARLDGTRARSVTLQLSTQERWNGDSATVDVSG